MEDFGVLICLTRVEMKNSFSLPSRKFVVKMQWIQQLCPRKLYFVKFMLTKTCPSHRTFKQKCLLVDKDDISLDVNAFHLQLELTESSRWAASCMSLQLPSKYKSWTPLPSLPASWVRRRPGPILCGQSYILLLYSVLCTLYSVLVQFSSCITSMLLG